MISFNVGRWSPIEHALFLEAMQLFGNKWRHVHEHVCTRSQIQCRTHAQKYFLRLEKQKKEGKAINTLLTLSRLRF